MTGRKYDVKLVESAQDDLYEIHRYAEQQRSAGEADRLLDEIEQVLGKLKNLPQRGHCPPELERIGITEYREVHCKPYRIVYAIHETDVVVHCVLDGRRDMQTLLQNRLLR